MESVDLSYNPIVWHHDTRLNLVLAQSMDEDIKNELERLLKETDELYKKYPALSCTPLLETAALYVLHYFHQDDHEHQTQH